MSSRFRAPNLALSALLALASGSSVVLEGSTFFVDPTATGLNNGTSWNDAFADLQSILPIAPTGSEIRVSGGVFRPDSNSNNRTVSFQLRSGITVKGGYAGRSQPNPDLRDPMLFVSALDGDIGVMGGSVDNSHHVVEAIGVDASAVLDGFTIRRGMADGGFPYDRGGGIYVSTASPTIVACSISSNTSSSNGGGVDVSSNSSPSFTNCSFVNNATTGNGGGMFSNGGTPLLTGCVVSNNSADVNGGGVSVLNGVATITNCEFAFNLGVIAGGGLFLQNSGSQVTGCNFHDNVVLNSSVTFNDGGGAILNKTSSPLIKSCLFLNNTSSDDGGAILSTGGSPSIVGCVFGNNIAADFGGAIYSGGGSMTALNSVFTGNRALDNGGAIYTSATITNVGSCTLVANQGNVLAGGIQVNGGQLTLNQSIVWANHDLNGWTEGAQITLGGATWMLRFNCVMGWSGVFGGMSNFSSPPQMADADGADNVYGTIDDNVHLLPSSPCINTGDPLFVAPPSDTDFDGQARVMGCRIDVGADEFVTGLPNSGDVNGDGVVNGLDISLFTKVLLGTAPVAVSCVADINGDLMVDNIDLSLFISLTLTP
ncbi:MAG: hypothetical protein HZA51_01855 [Planctomycetes bacterium]|nr:hypothetical protein [Planctomycetota bacterium]